MTKEFSANIAALGGRFMDGVPGFALVVIFVGMTLPLAIPTPAPTSDSSGGSTSQTLPVIVFLIAWASYALGHYLDDVLFGPIWGINRSAQGWTI
jgi:hypothetical protein